MRAPTLTFVVVVLGWPVLIVALVSGVQLLDGWRALRPPTDSTALEADRPMPRHPAYHGIAIRALAAFRALHPTEQDALRRRLLNTVLPLNTWLHDVEQARFHLICLGESHHESTRAFLAGSVLPYLTADVLALEATPRRLARINRQARRGGQHVRLLDADILAPLRAVRRRNPLVRVVGIEETADQRNRRFHRGNGSRESSIVQNFRTVQRASGRHIVLLGAVHCSDRPGWFVDRIRREPWMHGSDLNVRVLEQRAEGSMESFVYFLDALDVAPRPFVIANTRALPNAVLDWFGLLRQSTLDPFAAVIVFRAGSAVPDPGG